ncbi:hypothetical protein ACCAA_130008 [Candidatus Accumulibacter aalborgensis]|uniref:Uncharacterized protein n=1 Tax=Candidatus Accumulibacter aalborgensis TaxID=1860102 RepID=A0A1A8XJ96_9PROT|nr:hypothetical protein ACCAA_130008 [Candidatus Accumulibacter aalborgensis]
MLGPSVKYFDTWNLSPGFRQGRNRAESPASVNNGATRSMGLPDGGVKKSDRKNRLAIPGLGTWPHSALIIIPAKAGCCAW